MSWHNRKDEKSQNTHNYRHRYPLRMLVVIQVLTVVNFLCLQWLVLLLLCPERTQGSVAASSQDTFG